MANARKCDICHNYYDVPDINERMMVEPWNNTSMVRLLRLDPNKPGLERHDVMHFDACEKCLQDILDYILARQTDSTK